MLRMRRTGCIGQRYASIGRIDYSDLEKQIPSWLADLCELCGLTDIEHCQIDVTRPSIISHRSSHPMLISNPRRHPPQFNRRFLQHRPPIQLQVTRPLALGILTPVLPTGS